MLDSFLSRIEHERLRQQRMKFITRTCWALVCVSLVATAFVVLDRLLGIQDIAGRWVWTIGFVSSCLFIFFRWSRDSLRQPVSVYQVATQVENRYPQLRDLVTSGLEFSRQSEANPCAGSLALRRAIVVRAATETQEVDWKGLTDTEPLKQALISACAVVLLLGLMAWSAPHSFMTGFVRLINPLSSIEWPRDHHLQFVDPPIQVTAGQDVLFNLKDRNRLLPEEVTFFFRVRRNGKWHQEQETRIASGDQISFRKQSVQTAFEYRATGGDHRTMPWQQVKVIRPPRLEELTILAHSPQYTGLPSAALEQSSQVLFNSRLELSGVIDQPIKTVSLGGENIGEVALKLAEDGRSFHLGTQWIAKQSDNCYLNYTSFAGLSMRSECILSLEVFEDPPPRVTFEWPSAKLSVLPVASLPIAVTAVDNLALRSVEIVYWQEVEENGDLQEITLWEASEQIELGHRDRQKEVEYLWDLETTNVRPGSVLTVCAQASDYQPKVGRSIRPLTISIVSETQLLDGIHERAAQLAREIEKLLLEQRGLRASFVEWQEKEQSADERQLSELHVGLFHQRSIAKRLYGKNQGVLEGVESILRDHRINRLERLPQVQRLDDIEILLKELAATTMPTLEGEITELIRDLEISSELAQPNNRIHEILLRQDEVVAGLEKSLELLRADGKLGTFERELRRLHEDQIDLKLQCKSLVPELLQADSSLVSEEFSLCSSKQSQLRRLLAGLLRRMSEATDQIAQESPTMAFRVRSTVNLAREQGIEAMMIEAADHLADLRFGRAVPVQQEVENRLRSLLNRYTGRDSNAAAKRIEQLKRVEHELQHLRRKVDQTRQALRVTDREFEEVERVRRENQLNAEESEVLARKLERLQVRSASQALQEASAELRKRLADLPTAEKVLKKLSDAQRKLANERQRQQVALARLEMAKLETLLRGFVGRQGRIHEEILRLDSVREESGGLGMGQQQSVSNLAGVQRMLAIDVADQGRQFGELPVYVFALRAIGETMEEICGALQEQAIGPKTQQRSEEVMELLRALVDSVKKERENLDKEREKASGGGGGKKQDNSSQAQSFQVALGQLKLLKSYQLRLQKETRALESRLSSGEEGEDFLREAQRLRRQQQLLLEVAEQLQPKAVDLEAEEMFPNLQKELEQL